jgi:ParB-like chromosome segregation protein Spo0J
MNILLYKISLKGIKRRPHRKMDFQALVESVRKDGIRVPIVLAKNGKLLDGYYRVLAAHEAGLKEIPARRADI